MEIEFVDGPLRGRRASVPVTADKSATFLIAHLVRDLPGLRSVDEYGIADGTPGARWIRFVRYESDSAPGTVFLIDREPPGHSRGDGKLLRA